MRINKIGKPYSYNKQQVEESMKTAFKQDDKKDFQENIRILAKR